MFGSYPKFHPRKGLPDGEMDQVQTKKVTDNVDMNTRRAMIETCQKNVDKGLEWFAVVKVSDGDSQPGPDDLGIVGYYELPSGAERTFWRQCDFDENGKIVYCNARRRWCESKKDNVNSGVMKVGVAPFKWTDWKATCKANTREDWEVKDWKPN